MSEKKGMLVFSFQWFSVQWFSGSVFSVQYTVLGTQCSVFGVRCSVFEMCHPQDRVAERINVAEPQRPNRWMLDPSRRYACSG